MHTDLVEIQLGPLYGKQY